MKGSASRAWLRIRPGDVFIRFEVERKRGIELTACRDSFATKEEHADMPLRVCLRRLGEVAHIYLPKMTQAVCS